MKNSQLFHLIQNIFFNTKTIHHLTWHCCWMWWCVTKRWERPPYHHDEKKKNEIQNIFLLSIWLTIKAQVSHGKRKKIFMVKSSGEEEENKKFSLKKVRRRRRKVSTWEIFKNSVVATTMYIKIHFAWSYRQTTDGCCSVMRIIPRGWRKKSFLMIFFFFWASQRLFFPEGWRINKFDHPNERASCWFGNHKTHNNRRERHFFFWRKTHTQRSRTHAETGEIYLDMYNCQMLRKREKSHGMLDGYRDQQSTSDNRHISSLFSVEELSIVPHYCGIGNNIREIFLKSLTYLTPYPTYMLMKPPEKIFDIIFWYDRLIVPFLIYEIHRNIFWCWGKFHLLEFLIVILEWDKWFFSV